MERPLDDMLADKDADMPFCLCWANENWTRRWDASEHEVLIAQAYRPDDPVESFRAMLPYFRDGRYLTHEGRKLIVVYRPDKLPDPERWLQAWRAEADREGVGELHVVCALTNGNWSYRKFGFDGGVEFPPHGVSPTVSATMGRLAFYRRFGGSFSDFRDVAEFYLNRASGEDRDVFRAVFPGWDNTARRTNLAHVVLNGTPENYEYWLHRTIERTRQEFPGQNRLVFINAWNEWAEGCHLEPDKRWGHAFLEATLRAKAGSALRGWQHVGIPPDAAAGARREERARRLSLGLGGNRYLKGPKRDTLVRSVTHSLRDGLRVVRSALRNGRARGPES
jgi:lipopolysaccharide biosynthesis protein